MAPLTDEEAEIEKRRVNRMLNDVFNKVVELFPTTGNGADREFVAGVSVKEVTEVITHISMSAIRQMMEDYTAEQKQKRN